MFTEGKLVDPDLVVRPVSSHSFRDGVGYTCSTGTTVTSCTLDKL